MNILLSVPLIIGLVLLLMLIGNMLAGQVGMTIALVLGLIITGTQLRKLRSISTKSQLMVMMVSGAILVVVTIVALVARESIVSSVRQDFPKAIRTIDKAIEVGGYAAGAIGLILIAVGLIGYVQQKSVSTTAQTSTDTQSHQTATTSKVDSIPKQIEQLAKLKEQGILSETEFEEKKKDLLSRL